MPDTRKDEDLEPMNPESVESVFASCSLSRCSSITVRMSARALSSVVYPSLRFGMVKIECCSIPVSSVSRLQMIQFQFRQLIQRLLGQCGRRTALCGLSMRSLRTRAKLSM